MKTYMKIHRLLLGVFAVAALAAFTASPALAAKPTSEGGGSCPSATNLGTANDVGASVKPEGEHTDAYYFESFKTEEVSPGVPGLVKYCVYPEGVGPQSVHATYDSWLASKIKKGSSNFSFSRPGGNSTNIPYDEINHQVGTATWSGTAPTEAEQTIVLHINDEAECHRLYGQETSVTCFVLPGERQEVTCDESTGSTLFAYNAIPFGLAQGCLHPPAIGFQATRTAEFGDAVELEGGVGGELESLTVDLQSYACEEGFWNEGVSNPCKSPKEGEFEHPITAHFYEVGPGETVGPEIASAKQTETFKIPYRPSADPTECPDEETSEIEAGSKWKAPVSGLCVNSKSAPITFSYGSGVTLPSQVIWTVSFNTSNGGYSPLAPQPCNTEPLVFLGGCPYDSLNVGDQSYAGAPYAGTDVNEEVAYRAFGEPAGTLEREEGWSGLRPLGQIKLR